MLGIMDVLLANMQRLGAWMCYRSDMMYDGLLAEEVMACYRLPRVFSLFICGLANMC